MFPCNPCGVPPDTRSSEGCLTMARRFVGRGRYRLQGPKGSLNRRLGRCRCLSSVWSGPLSPLGAGCSDEGCWLPLSPHLWASSSGSLLPLVGFVGPRSAHAPYYHYWAEGALGVGLGLLEDPQLSSPRAARTRALTPPQVCARSVVVPPLEVRWAVVPMLAAP